MALGLSAIQNQLNFYRVHILFFTFTPLGFSIIFFLSNGAHKVSYVDALYNCVSAMTVCGLATVDLSSLTIWQQVILFVQMCLGSPVLVSWVMVYIRRRYFAQRFQHIIDNEKLKRREAMEADDVPLEPEKHWILRLADQVFGRKVDDTNSSRHSDESSREKPVKKELRTDMIRRMDDAPQLVNPSGWISEPVAPSAKPVSVLVSPTAEKNLVQSPDALSLPSPHEPASDRGTSFRPESPVSSVAPSMHRFETVHTGQHRTSMNRTQTIEFAPMAARRRRQASDAASFPRTNSIEPSQMRRVSMHRHPSMQTHNTGRTHPSLHGTKNSGFGGFPMPHEIIRSLMKRFTPNLRTNLSRTLTIPMTTTIGSTRGSLAPGMRPAPYISFEAVVGRNSTFHLLNTEQLEELGGVEYRALNALLWIVPCYHIGVQILSWAIIAPYVNLSKWDNIFLPPQQHKVISSTWFSLFQVVSSYTNTGMSLVDQSMVPFQTAYPMIFVMMFLILAGNTCFPIFLRFSIWVLSKILYKNSRIQETLHFLLDHPRRCFIYLFPSHQTWFLLTIVLTLTVTDWFFFMVLDIGNPAIEYVPLGNRFLVGMLQAIAVRAAGFGLVALSALAPAVKVLYVVMMYISVYPIAMSVRSTNVYEEQSLGVFNEEDHPSHEEESLSPAGSRVTIWSRYLTMHARKQLSFDMWWLGLALFLVCIIERSEIDNPETLAWFNIFQIIFELVSAYGTVGLSLGTPTANYSFSGSFRPLSKLIVCLVMIRGRHRGLPVAIDRAVMLSNDFEKPLSDDGDTFGRQPSADISISVRSPHEYSRTNDAEQRGNSRSNRSNSQVYWDERSQNIQSPGALA